MTMSDYMENNEAIAVLQSLLKAVRFDDEKQYIGTTRTQAIEHAIAVLESDNIIRCKDCKHFGTMRSGLDVGGYCMKLEWTSREPMDFCSWAVEGDNDYKRKRREP